MMRVIAYWISTAMVMVSMIFSWNEKAVTPEVWGLLLLTPLPIALAISIENKRYKQNSSIRIIWDEEDEDIDLKNQIGDPEEAGFDVPVL